MSPKMVYTRATARRVDTHAEILEWDYPELWDKAQELVVRLTALQENSFPSCQSYISSCPLIFKNFKRPKHK